MQTAVLSSRSLRISLPLAAAVALAACAPMSTMSTMYSQDGLPEAVKVPAGNKVVLQTVGVGEILHECRARKDMPGQYEWSFVGPDAVLKDRSDMGSAGAKQKVGYQADYIFWKAS